MHRRQTGGKFVVSKMKKMEVQETIAFIGGAGKNCPVLMKRMAQGKLRLLFLYTEAQDDHAFVDQLRLEQDREAEIEVVDCVKSSCWEADIIAFVDPEAIEAEVLEKIKTVATQKIVLLIQTEMAAETSAYSCKMEDIKRDLPYSKIVVVKVDSEKMTAQLSGLDKEALETVSLVLEKAGYVINNEQ